MITADELEELISEGNGNVNINSAVVGKNVVATLAYPLN